jgi:cation diffusion facilitator CzcD-associated flavoprotein CzcO
MPVSKKNKKIQKGLYMSTKLTEHAGLGMRNMWYIDTLQKYKPKTFKTHFVVFGTGYYDYREPLKAEIPELGRFKGSLIHHQFWPEDLNYTSKTIVVIGSGETAITVIPKLAEVATKVTML